MAAAKQDARKARGGKGAAVGKRKKRSGGKGPRRKGHSGEREIKDMLNTEVLVAFSMCGVEAKDTAMVQRNMLQSERGGFDLVNAYGYGIEVKRGEQVSLDKWWGQTLRQAQALHMHPVLVYRQNRRAWQCMLPGTAHGAHSNIDCPCIVPFGLFLRLFQKSVLAHLARSNVHPRQSKGGKND